MNRIYDRPPTIGASRFGGQQNARHTQTSNYDQNHELNDYEFKPATTVHDVVVIPGYFSSGEEDHVAQQQHVQG